VDLRKQLTPRSEALPLFSAIMRDVWKRKQSDSEALLRTVAQRLSSLAGRKNRLVDALLDGQIDQPTYEEQLDRLKAEAEKTEAELGDAGAEGLSVETILAFIERLARNPADLWVRASLEQKQRLQAVFFPGGLTYLGNTFGTGPTASFFSFLGSLEENKTSLASPTGFEPVLPP
jgi:hypothetical protein